MNKYLKIALTAFILTLTVVVTGCSGNQLSTGHAAGQNVSADQALQAFERQDKAVIIDVRTPGEYQEGHIPGAILIPLDQLPNRIAEIPKEREVLVICRSGSRSSQATALLREKGFANVYNITGGMFAWKGPVAKENK